MNEGQKYINKPFNNYRVTYEGDSFTKICLVVYSLNLMVVLLEYYHF